MAGTSPRIMIKNALEDLTPEHFSGFQFQLREPRGDGVLPDYFRKGQLTGKNYQGLADLLVETFAHHAIPVTVRLLHAIDAHLAANNLEKEAETLPSPNAGRPGGASGAAAHKEETKDLPAPTTRNSGAMSGAAPQTQHFVDLHRNQLIARVSNISQVLDHLLMSKVLTQEQYDKARAIDVKQDQMRFLFDGPLLSGGRRSKDVLLGSLKKLELYLIEELEETEA